MFTGTSGYNFPIGASSTNSAMQATTPGVPASSNSAYEAQSNPGGLVNWFTGTDPNAHNEAYYAWLRESASAREARDYDRMMADTQFQRKVADYEAAGFSPLAALENSGGNYTPSTAHASSSAAPGTPNPSGQILGAIVAAIAMIATKGIAAGSSAKVAAAKESVELAKLAIQKEKLEKVLKTAGGHFGKNGEKIADWWKVLK